MGRKHDTVGLGRLEDGRADVAALPALVPDELFSVGPCWAVELDVLALVLVGVEVKVAGGALVVRVRFPLAVRVDAVGVAVVGALRLCTYSF